jgi:beta-galactosidase
MRAYTDDNNPPASFPHPSSMKATSLQRLTQTSLALLALVGLAALGRAQASLKPSAPRQAINLDGPWQIAEGSFDAVPQQFTHIVPVPGLVDMAKPAFAGVGKKSALRQAFWYRRTFKVNGAVPEVALLKVHKARYGTKVWLNGQVVGEHLPCFTPGYFDLKPYLRSNGQENELLIRVGADREAMPKGMPTGWDFEKYLFIPGIYDSVELILTAAPYIVNIQTVPDLDARAVRIVAELEGGAQAGTAVVSGEVCEATSGKRVGESAAPSLALQARERKTVDFMIPIRNCRLWTPEAPFLYEVTLRTGADAAKVRFGLRSFGFEENSKYARLNGKQYFLRGSNVTIYRFFEDAERGDKPWRAEWVRRLQQKFKAMHWNALRYCIGFPPELWYDIADEEGILIQDEFPIWTLGEDPEKLEAEKIIPQYQEWMRERWNHPCVVIWDAQNESFLAASGKALQAVRHLDLSNRPWENGWAEPQSPTDCVESHPYRFYRDWSSTNRFRMSEFATMSGVPDLQNPQKKLRVPIIINEYAWLWLTRDGNPTCLTDKVYEHLLGPHSTAEQRRLIYAKYLAAKTEFWRSKRECAGVLHFCGLGYSRPGDKPRPEGGATSDHWINLEKLTFEPHFAKYVRDAFSPVGVMLDFWAEEVAAGSSQSVRVAVINDLEQPWNGEVRLQLFKGTQRLTQQTARCGVAGFGRETVSFPQTLPSDPGDYTLVAEVAGKKTKPVRSVRDFKVTATK